MTRRQVKTLVAAVAMVYLVVSALPVGAAGTLVVGSQHTTDSEFSAAPTLENVSVQGSGVSADVVLDRESESDSFEDGNLDGWTQDPSGSYNASTTVSKDGTYSAHGESTGSLQELVKPMPSNSMTVKGWALESATSSVDQSYPGLLLNKQGDDSYYRLVIDPGADELQLERIDSSNVTPLQTANVTIAADTWYWLELERDGDTLTGRLYDGKPSAGGTLLKEVSATDTTYSDGSYGATTYGRGSGYVDEIVREGNVHDTGKYISANHSVSGAKQAAINLTLDNASATATIQEWTGAAWQDVNSSSWTSSGNHTLAISSATQSTLRTVVEFSNQSGATTAKLHDESILFTNHAPTVDNGAASPQSGEKLDQNSVTLEIPVNDSEFSTTQGDSVDVTWYLDGSQVATETITSNQTVNHTVDVSDGGEHTWHVETNDSYGATTTSDTFTFKAPDQLYVYNETAPENLVKNVEVTVRFFASDLVVTKNTTDGSINLSGLPVDQEMVVTAEASGYYQRRVIIESIYQQNRIYLLNDTVDAVDVRFKLEDQTGQFGKDTQLFIEKPITRNGSTTYETVAADEFGVAGFTETLKTGDRLRLKVKNQQGDVRVLGTYTTDVSETVTLTIGQLTYKAEKGGNTYQWDASQVNVSGTERVRFNYSDPSQNTTNLQVSIHELGNESNEIYNQSFGGPVGTVGVSEPLTANESNLTWVVEWNADYGSEQISGRRVVGTGAGDVGVPMTDEWKHLASVFAILLVGGLFGGIRAEMGAVVVALVAGILWFIGWLPNVVAGGAVVAVLAIAVMAKMRAGGGVPG